MRFLQNADAWIGTNMFHPPAIAIMQRTGLTQMQTTTAGHYQLAAVMALLSIYKGLWITAAFWFVMILFHDHMLRNRAGIDTTTSAGKPLTVLVRMIFFAWTLWLLMQTVIGITLRGTDQLVFDAIMTASWMIATTGEYAQTIRHLPPPRTKRDTRKRTKGAPAKKPG